MKPDGIKLIGLERQGSRKGTPEVSQAPAERQETIKIRKSGLEKLLNDQKFRLAHNPLAHAAIPALAITAKAYYLAISSSPNLSESEAHKAAITALGDMKLPLVEPLVHGENEAYSNLYHRCTECSTSYPFGTNLKIFFAQADPALMEAKALLMISVDDSLKEDIMLYKQCCQAALQNEGIGFTEARRLTGEIIERLIEAKKQLGQRQPLPKS